MPNDPSPYSGSLVTLELGARLLGLPLDQVQGVLVLGPVTPVPAASPAIAGAVNVRGDVLAVVDLRRFFEGRLAAPLQGELGVQVRVGDCSAVLVGDRLGGVLHLKGALMRAPQPPCAFVAGQLPTPGGPVQLLQLAALFEQLQRPQRDVGANEEARPGTASASSGGQP